MALIIILASEMLEGLGDTQSMVGASVLLEKTRVPADGSLVVIVFLHDDLLAAEDDLVAMLLREVHAQSQLVRGKTERSLRTSEMVITNMCAESGGV